ncbi:MAG: hypothetical protein AAF957_01535 [Planctomycetota bacterium]
MKTPSLLPLVALAPLSFAQSNFGVSVDSIGNFGNDFSYFSVISDDGRYVAFQSESSNLAGGDGNGRYDIFRHDLVTGETELVSLRINGMGAANNLSLAPDISGDGRYVVWSSNASNIVPGDTNGTWDVFLHDMQTGMRERLSLTSAGVQANDRSDEPSITPDGSYVFFESDAALVPGDTNGQKDVYRLTRATGTLELVSVNQAGAQGNNWSYHADPSDDGRYVTFTSTANNLVPGDTNGFGDMFWKDMATGELRRVNVSSSGVQSNSESTWPSISGDGTTVVFCCRGALVAGDTNQNWDMFAHVVATGATERINVRPSGAQANSYVRSPASVSTDGRYVLYASLSTNLVPNDTNLSQDVFLRDRTAGTTERLNLSMTGGELNDDSWVPAMTPDVAVITYTSEATNIVTADTNGERQIFARRLTDVIGTNYCTAVPNSSGAAGAMSATGSVVVAANDVTLLATSLPQQSFGFFLASLTQGFTQMPGGSQGNLCLGGGIGRFVGPGEIQNSGLAGEISLAIDVNALPTPNGFVIVASGDTWNFQLWTRDSVGGTPTSNFTDGLTIDFR